MASDLESDASTAVQLKGPARSTWLKVGFVAAATALAGGLAVVWYHRKTLDSLRQEPGGTYPHFGVPEDQAGEDA